MKTTVCLQDWIEIFLCNFTLAFFRMGFSLFDWRKTEAECGHKTRYTGWINVHGKRVFIRLHLDEDTNNLPFCLQCIQQQSVLCAECREPILLGEPVTGTFKEELPTNAIRKNGQPGTAVFCLRNGCHESRAFGGFLLPGGKMGADNKVAQIRWEGGAGEAFSIPESIYGVERI